MGEAVALQGIASRYAALASLMDERWRRQWAAAEARSYGRGGVSALHRVTGLSPNTIAKGLAELQVREANPAASLPVRRRRPGAGCRRATEADPGLLAALEVLVDPATRGDPQSALRWTCKSTARLAGELTRTGHPVSARTVGRLLKGLGYSLQANRKTKEGGQPADRNAQFEHLNASGRELQSRGQPVISVDTKKKELVGEFKNGGWEWQRQGEPVQVLVHDFVDKTLGKVIPYGVYDLTENQGWVSVGTDHDTACFAVEAIHRWWKKMGARRYPEASQLLIMADGGGSNSRRCRLWKVALQSLAGRLQMSIFVCHFPPGTSKRNKIEHRMFSHITQNWPGRRLSVTR